MFGKGFKIVSQETTTVEDTNSNLYAKRCELELKQNNYKQAIVEIDKAIKYSNTTSEKLNHINSKLDIMYGVGDKYDLARYINEELPFFIKEIGINKTIQLICKNINDYNYKKDIYINIINMYPYDSKVLKEIINNGYLEDKEFIYNYIYNNLKTFLEEMKISKLLDFIRSIDIDEKINLVRKLHTIDKFDIEILNYLIELGEKDFVVNYLKDKLHLFVTEYGINDFMSNLRNINIEDRYKMRYLYTILNTNINRLYVLDEIIYYFRDNVDEALIYLDELIDSKYKGYNKLSLIYLRKGMLNYRLGNYKVAKKILKESLKMAKKEDVDGNDFGEILLYLSMTSYKLGKSSYNKIYSIQAKLYYKKALKYGFKSSLPNDIEIKEDYWYGMIAIGCITIPALIFILATSDPENSYNENSDSYDNASINYDQDEDDTDYETSENNVTSNTQIKNYIDDNIYNYSTISYNVYDSAYKNENNAKEKINELEKLGVQSEIVLQDNYYKVMVGNSETLEGAKEIKSYLSSILKSDLYILAKDSNVADSLARANEYIQYNDMYQAKDILNSIKNKVNQDGYEGYKKEYDSLQRKIEEYTNNEDIETDKLSIHTLLDNIFNNYITAVDTGNPDIMYQYLTYEGESYNSYKTNIPKFYNKNILIDMIDYNIGKITKEKNGDYRVNYTIRFKITTSDGIRYQTEEADYIIVKDSSTGKLLGDRIENWRIVE